MLLWHLTPDAPRLPQRVAPGERVDLVLGTWPIEPGQSVWVRYRSEHPGGTVSEERLEASWQRNEGENSYWRVSLGPFAKGERVSYTLHGRSPEGETSGPTLSFRVGPKLYLALMWHQHQPLYKDLAQPTPQGSYRQPWVRLHALRDYYSMAALIAEHPGLHLTINLTPVLLWQLTDYARLGASDRALELALKPAETLTLAEQDELLSTFFDAHWHHQIYPHPRYKELFEQRAAGQSFTVQDLRDLAMWFNLAWFGQECRDGEVTLATGEVASVRRFVEKQRGFAQDDIKAMVAEQLKILRAVIPLHRDLQERGQLEVTTTPFYHPILPLLLDTDQATIDRPHATHPRRFAHPEDAEAQLAEAVLCYDLHFGQAPRGMWPAEGAVSQSVIPLFAGKGVRWIATDQGVLARSGRWGYRTHDPEVLCQPYRAEEGRNKVSIFFRDTELADAIGFHYHGYSDDEAAAGDFLQRIKARFAERLPGNEDRVLTVVLDGENAWSAYREDARPFLHALYGLLEVDAEIETVTFSEYLEGNPARGIAPHPVEVQPKVYDLFTGSWIDENGSAPGVDLDT
jgi:alpha-amylase/alpha-mannosidase (GH57 family)